MFKRVLVPVDTSEYAEKALAYLPCFIDPTQTQVVLLSVLETMRYAATA